MLSVHERTREIGMLRAIGMTRRQLRRTIRFESAITAVIGSLLGLVVGLAFGWIVTRASRSEGLVFAVPWGTLILCLIVAAIVGVLAGVWPAWRASQIARSGRTQLRVTRPCRMRFLILHERQRVD